MELVYRVAVPAELDEILTFAEARLKNQEPDETARMFRGWHARWRREALEHYLKLGWSFTQREAGGRLVGFFLGQPFLFTRGMTQTLWIEHIDAETTEGLQGLVDVAVRLSREKHLQRVLFSEGDAMAQGLAKWPHSRIQDAILEVQTTKG